MTIRLGSYNYIVSFSLWGSRSPKHPVIGDPGGLPGGLGGRNPPRRNLKLKLPIDRQQECPEPSCGAAAAAAAPPEAAPATLAAGGSLAGAAAGVGADATDAAASAERAAKVPEWRRADH